MIETIAHKPTHLEQRMEKTYTLDDDDIDWLFDELPPVNDQEEESDYDMLDYDDIVKEKNTTPQPTIHLLPPFTWDLGFYRSIGFSWH